MTCRGGWILLSALRRSSCCLLSQRDEVCSPDNVERIARELKSPRSFLGTGLFLSLAMAPSEPLTKPLLQDLLTESLGGKQHFQMCLSGATWDKIWACRKRRWTEKPRCVIWSCPVMLWGAGQLAAHSTGGCWGDCARHGPCTAPSSGGAGTSSPQIQSHRSPAAHRALLWDWRCSIPILERTEVSAVTSLSSPRGPEQSQEQTAGLLCAKSPALHQAKLSYKHKVPQSTIFGHRLELYRAEHLCWCCTPGSACSDFVNPSAPSSFPKGLSPTKHQCTFEGIPSCGYFICF